MVIVWDVPVLRAMPPKLTEVVVAVPVPRLNTVVKPPVPVFVNTPVKASAPAPLSVIVRPPLVDTVGPLMVRLLAVVSPDAPNEESPLRTTGLLVVVVRAAPLVLSRTPLVSVSVPPTPNAVALLRLSRPVPLLLLMPPV